MSESVDKNQAVIDFLTAYNDIRSNRLYFNFGKVEDDAHQIIVQSDDVALHRPYVDGSILKRFTFSLDSFKSVTYNPIVNSMSNENVDDIKDVQDLLDWINQQSLLHNYPNFGEYCTIETMKTLSNKPELVGVDTTLTPPIGLYRISIQIEYTDRSECVWN